MTFAFGSYDHRGMGCLGVELTLENPSSSDLTTLRQRRRDSARQARLGDAVVGSCRFVFEESSTSGSRSHGSTVVVNRSPHGNKTDRDRFHWKTSRRVLRGWVVSNGPTGPSWSSEVLRTLFALELSRCGVVGIRLVTSPSTPLTLREGN